MGRAITAVGLVGAVVLALAVGGHAGEVNALEHRAGAQPTTGSTCRVEFAAVGASFTEAGSSDDDGRPGTRFDQTPPGEGSWAHWAAKRPHLFLTGGYAQSGATTAGIAIIPDLHVAPGSHLVIVLGTNNILTSAPPYESATRDLDRIIAHTGVPRHRVLVSLLPPANPQPTRVRPYNETLRAWGERTGVAITAPAAHMDAGDGTFKPAMTTDGVHLTVPQARRMGEAIGDRLSAMAGCSA